MKFFDYIFLAPIVILGATAAVHATAYLHGEARRHLPRFWIFFVLTLTAMSAVVLAPSPLTFLLAWEAMGLTSAGLVAFENREKSVRNAAWIYLLACHAGACALMLGGVMLDRPGCTLAAFVCAIVGFGLKIGLPPFHVWLPEAHPAAPAPVSAVMSGAMIPLGFCGILRFATPLGDNPQIWLSTPWMFPAAGWTLLALGAVAAAGGILFALPQTNLKRLLAYSSVENMGIAAIGFGLYFIDPLSAGSAFALVGALAHILIHALLKGALFLGAGSVLRQTGTLDQDRLGGLMKRMPKTGTIFALGALGLAGLPPGGGFFSELLVYVAAFSAVKSGAPQLIAAGFAALIVLPLAGGLAAAAYCKAIGAAFLGEPRSDAAKLATETPARMYWASGILLALSMLVSAAIALLAFLLPGCRQIWVAAAVAGLFAALTAALVCFRRWCCPRGGEKSSLPTWDCGYAEPTARMAYTGTAFVQPIADFCAPILHPRRRLIPFSGHPSTPTDAAIATETEDRATGSLWRPLFLAAARIFQRAHLLQNGSLHFYILLVIIAVAALLAASFI